MVRGNVLKEAKTFINWLMLRAAATRRGSESVLLLEEGKCSDVSYTTGVVVFIITYFHKLIHQQLDDTQTFFT